MPPILHPPILHPPTQEIGKMEAIVFLYQYNDDKENVPPFAAISKTSDNKLSPKMTLKTKKKNNKNMKPLNDITNLVIDSLIQTPAETSPVVPRWQSRSICRSTADATSPSHCSLRRKTLDLASIPPLAIGPRQHLSPPQVVVFLGRQPSFTCIRFKFRTESSKFRGFRHCLLRLSPSSSDESHRKNGSPSQAFTIIRTSPSSPHLLWENYGSLI
ncbi:hypothetical protein L2E82_10672 [Cichorium intybus]|uniref:Uncharacterized protein n=1 Tax=Cichorium intybus TaxID=13427 RepID=A0ACB9GC73_CICIN|nr:hypothetical protein L2E82_10672 [Cichorium intybus]